MITTMLFLRSELRGKRSGRIHCFCSVLSKHNAQLSTVNKKKKKRKGKKMYLGFLTFFEKEETKQRDERTLLSQRESITLLCYYYRIE